MKTTALVTAGGTTEPIDDVRVLSNISTGRLGHDLAEELALQGAQATLFCPKSSLERVGRRDNIVYEHFGTADSLQAMMLAHPAPTVVFHAAAVSDYRPVKHEGKLRSHEDKLVLELERVPKILEQLRSTYGKTTFIAGFKLLSHVSETELISAAKAQLHKNKLNMVVANDLQWLKDGQHPVIVVTAEGGTVRFNGSRREVARDLVAFALKRAHTAWFASSEADLSATEEETAQFGHVLDLAQDLNLLYDASGNVSTRLSARGMMVSPRSVDKSVLTREDGVRAEINLETRQVHYGGSRKPSIDTGMSAMLYSTYAIDAIMHFHSGWGRMNSITRFPFPCGAVEEAEEIIDVHVPTHPLAVELVHHGFLLGLVEEDFERLREEWASIREDFRIHLSEVSELGRLEPRRMKPIWDGNEIVGVIQADPAGSAVYLEERARGRGLGAVVVSQLRERGFAVKTVNDCGVRDYYKARGFTERWDEAQQVFLLTP